MAQLVGFVLLARIVAASAARATAAERVRTARIRAAIAVAAVLVAPRVVNGLQGTPSDSWNATRVVDPAAAALRLTRDGAEAIPWLGLGIGIGVLAIAWIAVAATAPRAFHEPDDEPAPVDGPTAETAR